MESKMKHWTLVLFLSCVAQVLPLAEGSHFRFGFIAFGPIDSQFNTVRQQHLCKNSFYSNIYPTLFVKATAL